MVGTTEDLDLCTTRPLFETSRYSSVVNELQLLSMFAPPGPYINMAAIRLTSGKGTR